MCFTETAMERKSSKLVFYEDSAPTFRIWDSFDSLKFSVKSISVVKIDVTKCACELVFSNHLIPQLISIKEIRTTVSNNEVQCLVMSTVHGDPNIMSSMEEFIDFGVQFFTTVFCCGLPFDHRFNSISELVTGYKNALNRWQSKQCTTKIEIPEWTFCLNCESL
jgi:hypothetical protein